MEAVVLRTPENWLELLKDIDFSAFDGSFGELELVVMLRNPSFSNGILLEHSNIRIRTDEKKEQHYVVDLDLMNYSRGGGGNRFDLGKVAEVQNPEFLRFVTREMECFGKVFDLLPCFLQRGYRLDKNTLTQAKVSRSHPFGASNLVSIRENKTRLISESYERYAGDVVWMNLQNLEMLKKKYGPVLPE